MITRRTKFKGSLLIIYEDGTSVAAQDHYGLSTDTKPVEAVNNGEFFIEMDTAAMFVFDEENATWHPVE